MDDNYCKKKLKRYHSLNIMEIKKPASKWKKKNKSDKSNGCVVIDKNDSLQKVRVITDET